MTDIDKEARIRLMMERIEKEEQAKRELADDKLIRQEAKQRLFRSKIKKYLGPDVMNGKDNLIGLRNSDWLGIITEINELLYESGDTRPLNYKSINENIASWIQHDLLITKEDLYIDKPVRGYKNKSFIMIFDMHKRKGLNFISYDKYSIVQDYSFTKPYNIPNLHYERHGDNFPVLKSLWYIFPVLGLSPYMDALDLIRDLVRSYLEVNFRERMKPRF